MAKPIPPENLWEAIERERKEMLGRTAPEGSLSVEDYRQRYGLTKGVAYAEICKLVETGALVPLGRCGPMRRKYYVLSQ